MKRAAAWIAGVVVGVAALAYAVLELTPWPSALFYRFFMNLGGEGLNKALEKHVPPGVSAILAQEYEPGVFLDVFHPAQAGAALPAIVWFHGGGFLAGDKRQVRNYLRILASHGYTTVAVGYSLSPAHHYPTPIRQGNAALGYLVKNAARLRVDPQRLFLAGDSAGAQLAAQLANIISVPSYAAAVGVVPSIKPVRGVILHCGVYDLDLPAAGGPFARHFMRTVTWSYGGKKDGRLPQVSVLNFVTKDFPPALISAGNGDPLLRQSLAMIEALGKRGVKVESVVFPGHKPELPHEYQFNLDIDPGRLALQKTVSWLANLSR